jgi:hypothetical protein
VSSATKAFILSFLQPQDDGGTDIIGYHVVARHVFSSSSAVTDFVEVSGPWFSVGTFQAHFTDAKDTRSDSTLSISIPNRFLDSRSYQLKLCAFNVMGNSTWSTVSNSARSVVEDTHENSLSVLGSDLYPFGLQLDFGAQVASQVNSSEAVSMWTGHWGRRHVKIHSGYVFCDVEQQEINLQNRIAVMLRDTIPVVTKAKFVQNRGGIGLLLVDSTDKCQNFDQTCMPGANRNRGEGFGLSDVETYWLDIYIPVALLMKTGAQELFKGHAATLNWMRSTLIDSREL